MASINDRLKATEKKLKELKDARKLADKGRRKSYKEGKADKERKFILVGQAVLKRVEDGSWDQDDFRRMMDEALVRQADRQLFDLE